MPVSDEQSRLTVPEESTTSTGRATVRNLQGMHFRPVGKLTQLAQTFACDVRIKFNGATVNAKSAIECTMLGAPQGSVLEIEACGPDAPAAVKALTDLIDNHFGMSDTD